MAAQSKLALRPVLPLKFALHAPDSNQGSAKNAPASSAGKEVEGAAKTPGSLRKARAADIPGILRLVEQNPDTILKRSTEEYQELLDLTWVVDLHGEIIGCATLEVYSPKIAEIRSVAVDANYRQHGYGRLLVQAAVTEARARRIREILVVTSNRDFFERLNFGPCLHEKYALFWNGK